MISRPPAEARCLWYNATSSSGSQIRFGLSSVLRTTERLDSLSSGPWRPDSLELGDPAIGKF